MTIENIIIQLTTYINQIPTQVLEIEAEELVRKPAPGKWSKKEIVGHLVDSAVNNLKRFSESQILPQPYKMIPYQQDELVIINRYNDLPADHILLLWKTLNQQIVYVMSNIPTEKLAYTLITTTGEPVTLEYWALDYLRHMEHHFKQIFGETTSV